jgi:hypothetical protein
MIAGGSSVEGKVAEPTRQAPGFSWQPQAVFETGLIICGFLALFFLMPHDLRGDDLTRLHDINQLLRHGHLTSSRFSLVGPLFSAPLLLLSHVVAARGYWADHFNTVVVAVGVLIAYRLLRGRYDARLYRLAVLVLIFASFLTNRLRDYNAETLTATLITLGIICLATNRHVLLGWAAIVIGVVNTPAALIGLALIAIVQAVRTRQLRHLAAIAAALLLIMLEAWIRRGGPLVTGYGGQRYNNPAVLGVLELLFSFGRGLLFFTPGLALWLNGRIRRQLPGRAAVAQMMVFVGGLILIYCTWWSWYGGVSWGPRFFTFAAIPASILIAAGIWRAGESAKTDGLTLGALALSAWVAFSGATANLATVLKICRVNPLKTGCFFRPETSSLWQPVIHFPALTAGAALLSVLIVIAFGYLAAPLATSIFRALVPRRSWTEGWRI